MLSSISKVNNEGIVCLHGGSVQKEAVRILQAASPICLFGAEKALINVHKKTCAREALGMQNFHTGIKKLNFLKVDALWAAAEGLAGFLLEPTEAADLSDVGVDQTAKGFEALRELF